MSTLSASRSAALIAALSRLGVDAAVWTDGTAVPPDAIGPYVWTNSDGAHSLVDRIPNSKGDQTHAVLTKLPEVATCLVGRVRSGEWDRLFIFWDVPTESNSTEDGK